MKKKAIFFLLIFIVSGVLSEPSFFGKEAVLIQDGHTDLITQIAFSPDNRLLATGSRDCTVQVRDLEHERLIATIPLSGEIKSLCFSPDSRYMAMCTEEQIFLWDGNNLLASPSGGVITYTSLCFSENSEKLIATGLNRNIFVHDVPSLQVVQVLNELENMYDDISFVNLGPGKKSILAAGSVTVKRRVWRIFTKNLETGVMGNYVVAKHNSWVQSVALSPGGRLLVSAGYDGRINLFTLQNKLSFLATFPGSTRFPRAAFFPGKEDTVAYIDRDDRLRISRVEQKSTGVEMKDSFSPGEPGINTFAFSSDGGYLAVARGRRLDLYNASFNLIYSSTGEREQFYSLAFSPGGGTVAAGGREVVLWDTETGTLVRRFPNSYDMVYRRLRFIDEDRLLGLKVEEDTGRSSMDLIRVDTGKISLLPMGTPLTFGVYPEFLAVEEKVLGERGEEYSLGIFDLETFRLIRSISHPQPLNALAFGGKGKIIAGGSLDGSVRFWALEDSRETLCLSRSQGPVTALEISPDGKYLAYGDASGNFYLWEIPGKKYLREAILSAPVRNIAFSPDSRRVLGISRKEVYNYSCDGTRSEMIIREGEIYSALFSPDNRKILTTDRTGFLKWRSGSDSRVLATSLVFPGTYLSYTPGGYYFSPGGGAEKMLWCYRGLFLDMGKSGKLKQQEELRLSLAGKESGFPEKEMEEEAVKTYPRAFSFLEREGKGGVDLSPSALEEWDNGRKIAVLIGISDYKNLPDRKSGLDDLSFAHKDVLAFKAFLEDQGKLSNGGWEIICLTEEEATNRRVDGVLGQVLMNAREKDLIYIFFSGHARKHPLTKDLYLLTQDFDPGDYLSGYDYRHLYSMISQSRARYIITFVDACFSGYAGDPKGEEDLLKGAIAAGRLPVNKVIISSSRGEESSYEDKKLGLGIFTYYLLQGLNGKAPDINHNRYVEIQELMEYLDNKVPAHSWKTRKNEQHPYEFGVSSEIRYNFPLSVRK